MQVGIKLFRYNTLGDTVTFVDQDGLAFIPDYIYLINGSCLNNTLYSNGSGAFNTWSFNQNLTEVSTLKSINQSNGEDPQFSAKICSGSSGGGINAFLNSFESDIFFGGNVYRSCKVTAVGSGFFTYQIVSDANYFTTDVIALCIKGISLEFKSVGVAGNYATSFDPKGIWQPRLGSWSNAVGGPATGAGGANNGWGWDSPNGGPFHTGTLVENQGGNYRYISPTTYDATINSVGPVVGLSGHVTAWGTNQFTTTLGSTNLYVVGGSNIVTASGKFNLNNTTGNQTFNTTIWPHVLFTVCVGTPTENNIFTDYGEVCFGFTNGVTGVSHWYGESTNGNVLPLQGACYISGDSLIRAVDVSGVRSNLTTFGTTASIVNFQSTGKATINVTSADSKPRAVYWFAIGETALPEIGGIYYINPTKAERSDAYYDSTRKIPNPKVRTALIGE